MDITATSGSCTYGTSLYVGTHPAQYAAYDMTGDTFDTGIEGETGYFFTDATKPAEVANYPKGLDNEGNEWKG